MSAADRIPGSFTAVTVGGLPGTGSSTLCRVLQERLGIPYVYAGQIFRDEAARRGVSLAELNAQAQDDEQVDRSLDDRQLELLREGGLIMEGRMSGWLAHHDGIAALKVWVTCDPDEAVRRLVARDGGDTGTQRAAMRDRVSRETDRYRRYYGVELSDLSIYDLVLDSTATPPDALADAVMAHLRSPQDCTDPQAGSSYS